MLQIDRTPRTEYHATAYDASGRSLPDPIWGWEMPQYADVKTIDAAREWATVTFARDPRAVRVDVRESHFDGYGPWRQGSHVETIAR